MSKSASKFTAVTSAIKLAVRRTESTVLRNIIVAATLLIVILLVVVGKISYSGSDPAATGPALNHNALDSSVLSARSDRVTTFVTRNGYAEFTGDMQGCLGVFAGDSRRLVGTVDLHTGSFDFHMYLKTLSTGIEQRDTELFASLNIDEHPFAEFTGAFHPAFDPATDTRQTVTASGMFTMNGVTHHLEIPVTLQASENSLQLDAEWILDITEFGIHPITILSVTVSNEQEIRLKATLEPQLLVSNSD